MWQECTGIEFLRENGTIFRNLGLFPLVNGQFLYIHRLQYMLLLILIEQCSIPIQHSLDPPSSHQETIHPTGLDVNIWYHLSYLAGGGRV